MAVKFRPRFLGCMLPSRATVAKKARWTRLPRQFAGPDSKFSYMFKQCNICSNRQRPRSRTRLSLSLSSPSKPATSQQQASNKPATSQQQASNKPATSQLQASNKPATSQQQASNKPATSLRFVSHDVVPSRGSHSRLSLVSLSSLSRLQEQS